MLGWYLDEEPMGQYPMAQMASKFATYQSNYAAFRALDPGPSDLPVGYQRDRAGHAALVADLGRGRGRLRL